MSKIKYGIIGFGGIAESRIAKEGFNNNPHAELIAVTDINPEREEAAKNLGFRWYNSVGKLLEDPEIEAVFIATNNSSHAKIAQIAIKKNKHCMIEKPITTTMESALKLQKIAREHKVSLSVDHMMTKNSYNKLAGQMFQNGDLGDLQDILLQMKFTYGATEKEAATWRCSKPKEFGGPIGDVGSHCLYMAESLLGDRISEVDCEYTPRTINIIVENGANIKFKTEKGYEGRIEVAFNQSISLDYEITGSKGKIKGKGLLFQNSGEGVNKKLVSLTFEQEGKSTVLTPETIDNIYKKQISEHALSIQSGNLLDGSEAIHNFQLILDCYKSADKK